MGKGGKRIKTMHNKRGWNGGYWDICSEHEIDSSIREWNKQSEIVNREEAKIRFKKNKKGRDKKWIGPAIPMKHLNIMLGLVNAHYKEMLDPNKRKKIWKQRKRRKEPIF